LRCISSQCSGPLLPPSSAYPPLPSLCTSSSIHVVILWEGLKPWDRVWICWSDDCHVFKRPLVGYPWLAWWCGNIWQRWWYWVSETASAEVPKALHRPEQQWMPEMIVVDIVVDIGWWWQSLDGGVKQDQQNHVVSNPGMKAASTSCLCNPVCGKRLFVKE
jgi:hypothetical protein